MIRRLGLVLLLAATAGPAKAGCQVALDGISFGQIDVMRRSTATGRVHVTCDAAVVYEVAIGGERTMRGSDGGELEFGLYMDPARNLPWGDGREFGSTLGNGSDGVHPDSLTIYGEIPAQPGTRPGTYAASPLVTLNF